jgi:hypothetical protein
MLSFITPAGEVFLGATAAALLWLLFLVGSLALLIWLLVTILRLPGLLERQIALQQQTAQSIREVLVEIRKVTQ